MDKDSTTKRMLSDMLTTFIPALDKEKDDPDTILLTTDELMARMQPVMSVNKDELSRMLFELGFRLKYEGDTWKWALKYT